MREHRPHICVPMRGDGRGPELGNWPGVDVLATAELVRHLIAVPFVLIGLAFVRWAEPIADEYAHVFGDLGFKSFSREYSDPSAKWWIRAVGALCSAVAAYWVVAGTG
jgi:hypothetical protein